MTGMMIWDANGNVIMNTNTFVFRFLGVITTNAVNGSVTITGLSSTGTPWYAVTNIANSSVVGPVASQANVTISANTITWVYANTDVLTSAANTNVNADIFYGVR